MKIVFLTLLAMAAIAITTAGETFTGVISDTMCGSKPHSTMKTTNQTDADCVRMCTKGPHEYALLIDGTNAVKLSDQKAAAKYPAQRVKVTGTYEERTKTIRVAMIELLDDK